MTSDVFRGRVSGLASVAENARWIYELLGAATLGLPVDLSLALDVADAGALDIAAIFTRLGISRDAAGWAQMVSHLELSTMPELQPYQKADLVVGFGLTPGLIATFDDFGIRILDLEISPLRFGDKLCWRARTTCPEIATLLANVSLSDDDVTRQIQHLAGRGGRLWRGQTLDGPSIGAIFGQTHLDLAVVQAQRLATLADDHIFSRIKELASTVDELHVVPHPQSRDRLQNLKRILEEIPNSVLEIRGAYSYFLDKNVKFISALSSSVLVEAKYWKIKTIPLIVSDRDCPDILPESLSDWVDVTDVLFSRSFWQSVVNRDVRTLDDAKRIYATSSLIESALGRPALADAAISPLPVPTIGPGIAHVVSAGSRASAMLRFGWHQPEVWGAWSSGEYACLAFRVASQQNITISLNFQIFASDKTFAPVVRLRTPGKDGFAEVALDRANGPQSIQINFAPECCNSLFVAIFEVISPKSPMSLGINEDARPLGVGLFSVEVVEGHRLTQSALIEQRLNTSAKSSYYERLHRFEPAYMANNWLLPYTSVLRRLKPERVVECGTGNGAFAGAMASLGSEVIGLDWAPSPKFPHSAPGVSFQIWDATKDPLPAADLVCSADFLEHLAPQQLQEALMRIIVAAPMQFHIIACYDDFHSHLTIEMPEQWLARFQCINPEFRLLDVIERSEGQAVAVITNLSPEALE
ncbi:class I SAM-dependent methyltransferase [Phreatobacter sp. AB_2022a]|uniref:class I SAM-dependent methyltransferase n=1 Tax=Phreatobacter sp. AB_2022a TaxID=3003134 RepID=UPI0022872EA5|nr:class I SAM-dependent methyltransferase [Phreatobacter sp. AB_2022a]MCZ0734424.1 class I SAM-dependent methyltransferase [Phreatobacter sp. AB_2022a]